MNDYFPAVAIGGPPHSGKSVLTYSLTQALRDEQIAHYVLRACPDGEGDWSNQAAQSTVRVIRRKGEFSQTFVQSVYEMLQNRHLPLLVDVGGQPTAEQEILFTACTHIVLIAQDENGLDAWRTLAQKHSLVIIAELHSSLTQPNLLTDRFPLLRGRLHGLERGETAAGEAFECLCLALKVLFARSRSALVDAHLAVAPAQPAIDLAHLAHTLDVNGFWRPQDLSNVLAYLPAAKPLAVYGRGPNWLYAAIAAHIFPAPLFQFDARLGWVSPPVFSVAEPTEVGPIDWRWEERADYSILHGHISDTLLDYAETAQFSVPKPTHRRGLVVSGRLPHWIATALVRAYREQPWVAFYQPQLAGSVVVYANQSAQSVGSVVSMEGIDEE